MVFPDCASLHPGCGGIAKTPRFSRTIEPMNNKQANQWTGGCQCGAVRYELLAAPYASICHCRMCQRASGGPIMAFARVKKGEVRWTCGAPSHFRSSSLVERGFCSTCGTPLTYNFLDRPSISVTVGSLDDPEAVRPELQFGVESTLSWFAALPSLPGKRTDEFLTADDVARFVNHQHPDHEI
jgi:hypothetical protein